MILKTNQGKEFIIDDEDYPKVKLFTWYISKIGYVVSDIGPRGKRRQIRLHRLLLNVLDAKTLVDHINRNELDNRKSNLRIANKQQNGANAELSKHNTSGFKGVSYKADKGKWKSYIAVNGRQIHAGYFNTAAEAARQYNKLAIQYFGTFANINHMEAM
jgi:hypothetical protein